MNEKEQFKGFVKYLNQKDIDEYKEFSNNTFKANLCDLR